MSSFISKNVNNVDVSKYTSEAPSALLYPDAASCSIPSLSPSIRPLLTPTRVFLWQQQNPVQARERRLCFSAFSPQQQASGLFTLKSFLVVSLLLFLPGYKMWD